MKKIKVFAIIPIICILVMTELFAGVCGGLSFADGNMDVYGDENEVTGEEYSLNTQAANVGTGTATMEYDNPVIMIEKYEIVEGEVAPGKTFKLSVTIKNKNTHADAFNVIVDESTEDYSLKIANGAPNQIYYETIPAGQTKTFERVFYVGQNYPYDNAMVTYSFYYANEQTKEFQNRTIITPGVILPSELTINVLSVAESAIVGSRSLINVRCTNTGNIDISDIVMHVEGDVPDIYKEISLGGLNAGEQLMKDCDVTYNSSGKKEVKISFKYTDKYGTECTIDEKTYEVEVKSSSVNSGKATNSNKRAKIIRKIIEGVAIGLVCLLIIYQIVLYRRRVK